MTHPTTPTSIAKDEKQIGNLTSQIDQINTATKSLRSNTLNRGQDISNALSQLAAQKNILEKKRNILLTRNRMLQLSQDRNYYKQKIIYTLMALIFACIILVLMGYTLFSRRAN